MEPMTLHYLSFLAAAQELAQVPLSAYTVEVQTSICRKHGIFLDSLTDDEFEMFNNIAKEYRGGR